MNPSPKNPEARALQERLAELLDHWEASSDAHITPEILCRDCPELLPPFQKLLDRLKRVNAAMAGNDAGADSRQSFIEKFDAGRYRPVLWRASGGQGWVFDAIDSELQRPVVLKCLQPVAASEAAARARLMREAEITSKLEHPGIVPIYGLGQDPAGNPYYAMRLVQGNTLGEEIQLFHAGQVTRDPAEQRLRFHELLGIFRTVCQTMAFAHARGVIHRDLNPRNIMVGGYGATFVIDWGLAKRIDLPDSDETVDLGMEPLELTLPAEHVQSIAGAAKGTPAFMSPEQARGDWDRVGPASDIYSLGATLFVLLTGQSPLEGRVREMLEKVKAGEVPGPKDVLPSAPASLDAICRKAMHFEPDRRYASADELARDVERWLADEPVVCWQEPLAAHGRRWVRRHRALVASVVTSAVVALLMAAALLARFSSSLNEKSLALDKKEEQLVQARQDLIESHRNEQAALQKATETWNRYFESLKSRVAALNKTTPEMGWTMNGQLSILVADQLSRELDSMAQIAPNEALGKAARMICDDPRLHVIKLTLPVPATVVKDQLDATHTYVASLLNPAADKPSAARELGRVYLEKGRARLEQIQRQGPPDQQGLNSLGGVFNRFKDVNETREALQRAFQLFASEAALDSKIGRDCTLDMADATLLLVNLQRVAPQADVAADLDRIDQALSMLRRFHQLNARAEDAISDEDRQRAASEEMALLEGKSLLFWDQGDSRGTISSLTAALAVSRDYPPAVSSDRFIVARVAEAYWWLAIFHQERQDYAAEWEALSAAREQVVAAMAVQPDAKDFDELYAKIQVQTVEGGLLYLRSLDAHDPKLHAKARPIADVAWQALADFDRELAAQPATERKNAYGDLMGTYRLELARKRHELEEPSSTMH